MPRDAGRKNITLDTPYSLARHFDVEPAALLPGRGTFSRILDFRTTKSDSRPVILRPKGKRRCRPVRRGHSSVAVYTAGPRADSWASAWRYQLIRSYVGRNG